MTENMMDHSNLSTRGRVKRFTAFMLILAILITGLPMSGFDLKEVKAADPPETGEYTGGMQYYDYMTQKWSEFLWYRSFESLWEAAVSHPGQQVYVKLFKDVKADNTKYRSFGKGKGFKDGAIYVPKGSSIRLDLAGHMIDRHLTLYDLSDPLNYWGGYSVIRVDEDSTLTVEDSKPYVQHDGYYDEDLGVWFPKYRYNDLVTYPSKRINLNRVVPIYGGIICGGAATYGGGISNSSRNAEIILEGGNIVGNVAKYGGGLGDDCARVWIKGGTIAYNYAAENGGGVFTKSAENKWRDVGDDSQDLRMSGGVIMRNTCKNQGGGVYADCTDHAISLSRKVMQFNDGVICANYAREGGGLFQNQGRVELNGGLINGNWARISGGGVYANGYMDNLIQGRSNLLVINGVTITENTADWGGGLYVNTKKCAIGSATITNNEARSGQPLPGGGIYIADNDFLQFTGGKIIVQDNVQTPTGARSNISCENLKDFNGEHNYNYTLGSGSCVYVNFRKNPLVEGLTFGDYLSGTPGTIQLDDDRFYAVPNEDSARYWVVMKNYYQNWRIKMKVGNEPAAAVGDKEYSYINKSGNNAKAIAKRGEVGYASVIDMRDMRTSYYYTDAYFTDSKKNEKNQGANDYDHHLATMSAALAMSAFRRPYKGAENQGKNVRELMENLGMSDIELTYPEPARKGDNDYTIGYAIGKKTLTEGDNKGKTLITIATRGANYMTEWGSNTTLNYRDYFYRQAAGFSDAADKVTQGVIDYLSERGINGKDENTIFWITGYSRGGATANLTAQRLTDWYNNSDHGDGNRVYAYPIEAPQGAYQQYASGTGYGKRPLKKDPKDYKNIHNIINPSDLVPLVAPAAMGFSRFGVDHLIPGNTEFSDNSPLKFPYVAYSENGSNTAYKTTKEEMVKQLAAIDTRIGFNDRFQHSTMSFINNTIHGHDMINLNGDMDAPENWYGGFLQGLLHYALISDPDEKKSSEVPQITYRRMYSEAAPVGLDANGVPRLAYGDKNAEKVSVQTALETAIVLVFGLDDETSKKLTERLGRCSVALDKGYKCSDGTTLEMSSMYTGFIRKWKGLKTDEKNAKIKELWELVSLAGLDSVLSKQQYNDFRKIFPVLVDFAMKSVSWDWKKANSNNLGTLLANAETIAEAHYPEVNLAWLRAQDSFFKNDGKDIYIGRRVVFDPVQAIDTKITNKDGKTAKKSQDAEVYDTYLEDEIRLNLSTKTSGAKILYTLNGEDPKLRSYGVKVYDSPIRLTSKQGVRKLYNIRMVACKDGVYSPETNYRCDVYPGGDKYTLTVRYEGDRSETFRLRKGDTIELFKTTKDRTYKWKSWDLVSYSGSGGSVNSNDYDWDEMSKKKDAELKKLIKEDRQRSTVLEMPAKDLEIEGVYVKLADNVHLQYEPHTRFTKDSKVEWCVETEEENFCSPNYVLPADADEDDYTIVDAYPRLYVYENGSYGELIQLEFIPSAMSEDMPEFTDISLDEDVPDGMSVASSADGVMDLYINDVYVAYGKRHKTNRTGDGTPYGIIEAIYKNSEMCARVSFEEFPLISAEFGKTDHLFVFKNGTPREEILTKFPEFTSFKSGGCSYLIKNIWPDDLLKNYDPNKSSTQKFEIYAQPDEKDFADRYPNLNTGDLKIFEKYRTVKPKCTISVKGYANAYIPWIYIETVPGDSGEGTKANPYKNDVKIRIKNSQNNTDLENCLLHYSVDGGKTYKTCSENEVVIELNNPKTDKDGCATICAYVTADRVWGGGSSPRVKRFYIKPTRNVKLNLALLSGMFKSHYGKRWTVSDNGLGGTIKESPANESVFLNGVMYYSKYKDVGLIRQYAIQYGSKEPEIREIKNRYSGLENIQLGDITRDEEERIEDVTISGIYDLGIDKVKLELDEDKSVDKIWVHTYVDENGEKPSDELIELDEGKYEADFGENPNEIIIKLKEGEGYSWCSTGTIKKADDDTVIDSLKAKNGTCSYELSVELRNENKEYPVWIGLTAEDDPSGDDYVLDYFKKGDTVNLIAPDWESHTFKQWTAEGVTITNPESHDNASFTMSANEVRIRAEYNCYENINELTLNIPKVLAYNELPDGSTVSADIVSGNFVAAASFAGWQDKAPGFNREVKAAVKLIPQKGYEFREKTGSDVAVDTNFKVNIRNAGAVSNAVVKAMLLDDGSVLAIVKQTTDKGVVSSVKWDPTGISVSANAIDDDDDLRGLVPDKVTVNCTNPKSGGADIPVILGVTKGDPDPSYGSIIDNCTITAILADGDVKLDDLSIEDSLRSQSYTITLIDAPLNVKSIDWGRDEVFRISKDATEDKVKDSVPNEVWVTFTRENESTEITMSVPVKKTFSTEMGNPIVKAELGIKTDNEGTDGYTNKDNVALTHVYTFEVPDYHSVYVTDGTAAGNTVRNFDKPEWVTDASAPGQGELKWLEENDVVTVTAAVKSGQRFVRWDVSGTIIDDVEDPVLFFDMADNDVSITAVYDTAIDDISPEISADRKRVESVNINGSGVLDASAYTASVTGNKVSIKLNKGCGWFFDNETKLNENEEVMQSITRTGDYSADFVMWPEKLYVSVSTVDDKGSVISGTEETHIGIYEEGNKVETSCPDVDGYKFKEWKSNVEGLVLTTGENNSVSFTMPDKDVRLSAVFVPYDTIDHVTLQIDAPQARQALPENSVIAEADGGSLDNTKTKMMWSLSENEIPDYGEEVTAIVTLAPDENSKFITSGDNVYTLFELEEDDEYIEIDDVMLLPDGSVDLYIDFTTDKRRLTSIDWGDTDITGGLTITGELSGDILPGAAELKFADAKSDEDPVLREIIWPSLSANIVSQNSVSGNKIRKTETDEAFIYTIIGELDLSEDVGDDDTGLKEGKMQLVDLDSEGEEDQDESIDENSGWLDTGDVPLTQTFTVTLLKEPKPNKPYIDISISDEMNKLDISFVADVTVSECNIRYDHAFAVDDEELNIPEPSGSDKTISYNAVSVSDNKVTVSVNKADYIGKFVTFGIKAITETKSTSVPVQIISSNTAVETVEFYIPGERSLSVNMVDTYNVPCAVEKIDPDTGETVSTTGYSFDDLTEGSEVDLFAPTAKDAAFFRWEIPSGISVSANATVVTVSGDVISGDTLSENNVDIPSGMKGYTNSYITLTMPESSEKTTYINARFKPLVKKVSVDIEEPKADMLITSVKRVAVTVTDEYTVDNANIDAGWVGTISKNGAEYFDPEATEYTLDIELKPDTSGNIRLNPVKGGAAVTRKAADIMFAPAAKTIVNGEVDDYAFLGTEEGTPYLVCEFDNTQMYEDLDDGPDKEAVVGSVIDNVFGTYSDEEGQYEYTFDKVKIDNSWKADISDRAGRSLYIRYRAVDDDPESKWTTIELPPSNDDMPAMTYYYTNGTIGFEGVDKWQYRLNGQSEWKNAPSAIVSPDELGWDGTATGIEVRRAGDQTRFPGRSSQIVLKARPAAPTGFTVSDNSAAIRGTVTGTFDSAAGKQIEIQVRYPDRSDDWTAYHQGRFITVDENGRFIIDKLADSRADVRIRILEEGEMPSQWATASVTISKENTINDENLVEKRYSVNYVFEYGGQRLVDSTDYVYAKDLKGYDGKVYGISANRKWFDERANEMLGSDSRNAIVSFVIKGRAGNSDGSAAAVAGDKEDETILATIEASKFKDNSNKVAYGSIPVDYNEITVYARIGSFATMRDTTEGVYISSPLPVGYTGLAHKLNVDPSAGKKNSGKSASYDIDLEVRDTSCTDDNGDSYMLVYGKDYTVSYKNNTNASVKYDPASGKYTPLYTDVKTAEKKSPQMIIKGKGNYKKLKAVVYFDILPLALTAESGSIGRFESGQIKSSYILNKNGGIKLSIKPVRYARTFDKVKGVYVTDDQKRVNYSAKDITMMLQRMDEASGSWDNVGSLDKKDIKATLKKVTTDGLYRIRYTGSGNFYGTGLYDQFDVYKYGDVLFSSLKVKTSNRKYASGGVSANELVTGISTTVKNAAGKKVKLSPDDYSVSLTPASDSAEVKDGNKAMSAGIYKAQVSCDASAEKYPGLRPDGTIEVTVKVTGEKLKSKMVTLDWASKGEDYNGKSKDITVTLTGAKTSEVTLAKRVMLKGKEQFVPLTDEEFAGAVKERTDDRFTVRGTYRLSDGTTIDNTLPGKYTIVLFGKGKYGGSLFKKDYKRLPVKITSEMLKASDTAFNIGGVETEISVSSNAIGLDEMTYGKGDDDYSVTYSGVKKATVSGNMIGTATATVKVKSETTGLKKGSSAKVTFNVYERSAYILRYEDYSYEDPGALYIQVAGDVKSGSKPPKLTLYQSSEDGTKLKKIPEKYYTAAYTREPVTEGYESAAPSFAVKISAGKEKGYNFTARGITIGSAYSEYKNKAKKWGDIKLSGKAAVIRDEGNGMSYTDRNIDSYASAMINVDTSGKTPVVSYVGNSYILPIVDEVVVDGITLKRADGDFIVTYKKNNKPGTAGMTITLTPGRSDKTIVYPLGGSKSFNFKIVEQKNKDLKL